MHVEKKIYRNKHFPILKRLNKNNCFQYFKYLRNKKYQTKYLMSHQGHQYTSVGN